MAGGIIARLTAAGLNGEVPVTGQDASIAGLQAILNQPLALPPRQSDQGYVRPPMTDQTFVPEVF